LGWLGVIEILSAWMLFRIAPIDLNFYGLPSVAVGLFGVWLSESDSLADAMALTTRTVLWMCPAWFFLSRERPGE
jgi:hypothetical protein